MTRWHIEPIGPQLPHDPEAAKAAGVTYRQLDYWTRRGYLAARPRRGIGSGYNREYLPSEIRIAAWMGMLTASGMVPSGAAEVARDLESTGRASLGALTLHVVGAA